MWTKACRKWEKNYPEKVKAKELRYRAKLRKEVFASSTTVLWLRPHIRLLPSPIPKGAGL